jgi:hypothetical protein
VPLLSLQLLGLLGMCAAIVAVARSLQAWLYRHVGLLPEASAKHHHTQ